MSKKQVNWNGMHRIQLVKMKDNRFIAIDWTDINQIKSCIEEYCGYEFSSLINNVLDDFILRLESCGYYLENIGYHSIDINDKNYSPAIPDTYYSDTYKTLAEKAKTLLEEKKSED